MLAPALLPTKAMHGEARSKGGRRVSDVTAALLSYLERRPNSMDTLDGIASFWLSKEQLVDRETLVRAVEGLVAEGRLQRIRTAGISKYRLTR